MRYETSASINFLSFCKRQIETSSENTDYDMFLNPTRPKTWRMSFRSFRIKSCPITEEHAEWIAESPNKLCMAVVLSSDRQLIIHLINHRLENCETESVPTWAWLVKFESICFESFRNLFGNFPKKPPLLFRLRERKMIMNESNRCQVHHSFGDWMIGKSVMEAHKLNEEGHNEPLNTRVTMTCNYTDLLFFNDPLINLYRRNACIFTFSSTGSVVLYQNGGWTTHHLSDQK